jgi:PAS domain S-box-containing protein
MEFAEFEVVKTFEIGEGESVLDVLIRQTGDPVHAFDLDGRVMRWNPACEVAYGWTAREVLGKALPFVPDGRRLGVLAEIRTIAAEGGVTERDGVIQRADGTKVRVRMTAIPLVDAEGDANGVLVISREPLEDERADGRRDEFMRLVDEGLREPMAAIVAAAEILDRPEVAADRARRERIVALIARRARIAAATIEDMALVAAIAGRRLVLDREPIDPAVLLTRAIATLGEEARRVIVDFEPASRPVLVDAERLVRATALVLLHAVRRAPPTAVLRASLVDAVDAVVISIARGTAGSHSEARGRSAPLDGSALSGDPVAVRLVRGIVEAHGGTVAFEADDSSEVILFSLPRRD